MADRKVASVQAWSPSRKLAAVVLVVAAAIAVFAASSSSDDGRSRASTDADELAVGPDGKPLPGSGDLGSDAGAGTDAGSDAAAGGSGTGTSGAADGGSSAGAGADAPYVPPALPLDAEVEGTKGLQAGDVVTVTVDAEEGSLIYGVEMRMCRAGTVVRNDGDMLPTVSGNCISKPLSTGADAYKVVASDGARTSVTATYTVGTGTDTFPLDDGGTGSVTCDADHPCVLAVKYQIPDGFGFRTYPLTFS